MRFISLASGHAGQGGQASAHGTVDGIGDRAAGTAAGASPHARQAVGVGQRVHPRQVRGRRVHVAAYRRTTGDPGEVTVTKFSAAQGLIDSSGGALTVVG